MFKFKPAFPGIFACLAFCLIPAAALASDLTLDQAAELAEIAAFESRRPSYKPATL